MRNWVLVMWFLSVGCALPCVQELDLDCEPLYTDLSWDNVHAMTIEPSCAWSGCHAAIDPAAGLVLTPADTAWQQLVEPEAGSPSVIAGDAACSEMIIRAESGSANKQMPPGVALTDAELCVLRLWVDQGALP